MSSTGPLAPGTLVAGRYRIDAVIDGEGSGAAHRATDTRAGRAVVLRAVPMGAGRSAAAAAAALAHPNVAPVLEIGEDEAAGVRFAVADPGAGGTLAALLAQRGRPPLPLALRLAREAAAGIAAAHAAGVVHGDLHPGMLWLSRGEGRLRVQVLGMGVDPSGTLPPRASARYAAPERLRRAPALTAAADVFSLGVIAHELLAGLPEGWTSLLVAMARGQAVDAPDLAAARPEVPARVARAIRRALAAAPEARWADAGALAAQLADGVEVPASAPVARTVEAVAPTSPVAPEPEPIALVGPQIEIDVERPEAAAPKPEPARPPAIAATDLADTLYIPAPASPPESPPVAAPVPAPQPQPTPTPTAMPTRTRSRMDRLAKPTGPRPRTLMAAGVALALLLGGAVAARALLTGPAAASADTGRLAARALTGTSAPAEVESAPAERTPDTTADTGRGVKRTLVVPPTALPAADAAAERERLRLETERRERERREALRRDSLHLAGQTAQPQVQTAALPPLAAPRAVQQRPAAQSRTLSAIDAPAPSATPAQSAAAPDPSRVYGGGEVDRAPALANARQFQAAVQRTYPTVLRSSGTAGTATVSFVVLPDGRVDRASISVGDATHPAFRGAASNALASARFTPATVDGRAVRVRVSMPIAWQPTGND